MRGLSNPIGTMPILLSIFLLSQPAQAKYSGGSGTAEDPYQIAKAEDLITLGETPEDYDKHFILTRDIDLDPNLPKGKVFDKAVIAPDTDPHDEWDRFQGTPFTGVFHGKGYRIAHLTIQSGRYYAGLFGQLGPMPEVKNLGVVHVNITGSTWRAGGLVGSNNGTVIKCYSSGRVGGGG